MRTIFLVIILVVSFNYVTPAQQSKNKGTEKAQIPDDCEISLRKLDNVGYVSKNKLLIVIARFGTNDSQTILAQKRLNSARNYLVKNWKQNREKIIVAYGEKVTSLSRLDFYVEGELFESIFVAKGKNVPTSCNTF
jgi:hypothetical protein